LPEPAAIVKALSSLASRRRDALAAALPASTEPAFCAQNEKRHPTNREFDSVI
jgi:hypothetical protein